LIQYENISIKGIIACVPEETLEIEAMDLLSAGEKKTIRRHYGIERIHRSNTKTTYDLCLKSAEELIKNLKWDKSDIDFVISVTQTPDYLMPSNATMYQTDLGLRSDCILFEVNNGCAGYVQSLMIASGFLQNTAFKKGLILCGETTYNVSKNDKATYPYMGDAGTATAIIFDTAAHPVQFNSWSNGSFADAIQIRQGGARSHLKAN